MKKLEARNEELVKGPVIEGGCERKVSSKGLHLLYILVTLCSQLVYVDMPDSMDMYVG